MPTTTKVKRGDSEVRFTDTLTADGSPVDLTGASVLFLLRSDSGALISQAATVVSAAAGTVAYVTTTGDLDDSGKYRQEWQVTDGSSVRTFPSDGWNTVLVLDDLNP